MSSVPFIRSIVLDLAATAPIIVAAKNQEKGIGAAKETLHSLSKEKVLSLEKVQAAFEIAMKHLHEDICHLPQESQKSAFAFLEDSQNSTENEFTRLKKCQNMLRTDGARWLRSKQPNMRLRLADESELWHIAVENTSRVAAVKFSPETEVLIDAEQLNEVEDDLTVLYSEKFHQIVGEMTEGILSALVIDTIQELDRIEGRKALIDND